MRTLKLVLREFQRRWMKAEQSSSEQVDTVGQQRREGLIRGGKVLHYFVSSVYPGDGIYASPIKRFGIPIQDKCILNLDLTKILGNPFTLNRGSTCSLRSF